VLSGTADLGRLSLAVPNMERLDGEPVHFEGVEVVQAAFETSYAHRQATLPPGLHPTTPPMLVLLAWRVPDSPWGPFGVVQARVSCRSGVRPRGYVTGAIVDNPNAAELLSSRFGLPAGTGTVSLERRYDCSEVIVACEGERVLHLICSDPDPLSPTDVQFSVTSTLAQTPRGLRLVQVEPEYNLRRVERIRPRLVAFNAKAWGEPLLEPRHPVSATVSVGDIAVPRLRYVSRPDVTAFEGTEKL
jgi:hypothetical protein